MRHLTKVLGNFASVLRTVVVEAPIVRIACLAALGFGLTLANAGAGDENENPGKSKKTAPSVIEQTPPLARNNHERKDGSSGDDSVRHHGALGVLLSKSPDGVIVVGVIPGSPADRGGMRVGDEIRYVDDKRILAIQELIDEIREFKPGTQVDLTIRRNGRRHIVTAGLATVESTFGNREDSKISESGRSGVTSRSSQQANNGIRSNSSVHAASKEQLLSSHQLLIRRIRSLEREIDQMQRRINALQSSQSSYAGEDDDYWGRMRRGENDDDPALFQ